MRTLNVAEMTLRELGNVVWNSECPIARAVCLDEMKKKAQVRA